MEQQSHCVREDNRVIVQDGTTESLCKMEQQSVCRMEDARWNNRVSVQDGTIESVCKMGQMNQCTRWDNRVSVQDRTTVSVHHVVIDPPVCQSPADQMPLEYRTAEQTTYTYLHLVMVLSSETKLPTVPGWYP